MPRPEPPGERARRQSDQFWFVLKAVFGAGALAALQQASRKLFGWP